MAKTVEKKESDAGLLAARRPKVGKEGPRVYIPRISKRKAAKQNVQVENHLFRRRNRLTKNKIINNKDLQFLRFQAREITRSAIRVNLRL